MRGLPLGYEKFTTTLGIALPPPWV